MLFQITWIKQVAGKQENMSFVIDAPDEATVRDLCWKHSIALFELKPYVGQREAFGQVPIKIIADNVTYDIITPFEKAKDAYTLFSSAWFHVTYINSYQHWMSDEDVAVVLEKLESEQLIAEKKAQDKSWAGNVVQKNITNVVLQKDPELEKMRHITTQAVSDMEEIKDKAWNIGFPVRKLNDMKELEEELKKTRMGSNIPKMRSLVSDAYKMMEEVEMEYLDQQKAAETVLIADSVVTHLDLIREYEKYEKAQKVKKWKLEKTPSDIYYIFLGKAGIYQRFLGKDLEKKLSNSADFLYKSIDYMIMFVFMCLIWLTITSLYQHYILRQNIFFFTFVDFGLIWLILIVINKLKKHNPVQILALFIIGAAVYFGIRYLIVSNFAL